MACEYVKKYIKKEGEEEEKGIIRVLRKKGGWKEGEECRRRRKMKEE